MDQEEFRIVEALDLAARSEAIVARVEQTLRERPDDVLAWEPIPRLTTLLRSQRPSGRVGCSFYAPTRPLGPSGIPTAHQRMVSYRGSGHLGVKLAGRSASIRLLIPRGRSVFNSAADSPMAISTPHHAGRRFWLASRSLRAGASSLRMATGNALVNL